MSEIETISNILVIEKYSALLIVETKLIEKHKNAPYQQNELVIKDSYLDFIVRQLAKRISSYT
jgi:hypothetical protein